MPHFGHVSVLAVSEAMDGELTDVLIDVLAMSSRSVIGRRDASRNAQRRQRCAPCVVVVDLRNVGDIDPDEPLNMLFLLALDRIQVSPQSFWLKFSASQNIASIVATLETSHFEMSQSNNVVRMNM